MKASKWSSVGIVALLATSLVHCSQSSSQVPLATVSEAQAKTDLDFRLGKTQQVRGQIASLRDEIRPIGAILRDLGSAVDFKVDRHPGSVFAGLFNRLNQVLQGAVNGVVETHADGSWLLEHPSPLSVGGGQQNVCAGGRVRLSGQNLPAGEQIVVALSSCASPAVFETLVTVLLGSNGSRLLTISSATFENLQNQSVTFDPCTMSVDAANNVDLSCKPLNLATGSLAVSVERLEYHTDARGTHASIHLGLADPSQGSLGNVEFVAEPGLPAEVRICTGGPACAP